MRMLLLFAAIAVILILIRKFVPHGKKDRVIRGTDHCGIDHASSFLYDVRHVNSYNIGNFPFSAVYDIWKKPDCELQEHE